MSKKVQERTNTVQLNGGKAQMKIFLVLFTILCVPLFMDACYTYRTVSDLGSESTDREIRITTRDVKVFHLCPWELDSSGAVVGTDRTGENVARSKRFTQQDIQTIELREYNATLTAFAAAFVAAPLVWIFYMAATWDM